jgi:hypothetical protein
VLCCFIYIYIYIYTLTYTQLYTYILHAYSTSYNTSNDKYHRVQCYHLTAIRRNLAAKAGERLYHTNFRQWFYMTSINNIHKDFSPISKIFKINMISEAPASKTYCLFGVFVTMENPLWMLLMLHQFQTTSRSNEQRRYTHYIQNSHTAPDAENALHCSTHIPGTFVRGILWNAVNYTTD